MRKGHLLCQTFLQDWHLGKKRVRTRRRKEKWSKQSDVFYKWLRKS